MTTVLQGVQSLYSRDTWLYMILIKVIFMQSRVSQSGEPHPILDCERLSPLRMLPSSWYYRLLPLKLFACGMCVWNTFPVFCCPSTNCCVAAIKFRISICLQKSMLLLMLNTKYKVFILLTIGYISKRISNWPHSVFSFLHSIPTVWESGTKHWFDLNWM